MKPFQNAFGSLQRVDGRLSANKSAELLITQRVEALPGFDNCALRVDDQQQDDDAFALPCRFIITSQLADSPSSRLEAQLALQKQDLHVSAFCNRIRATGHRNSLPKFLFDWVKLRARSTLTNNTEHHDRPRDASRLDLLEVLMRDRESQSDPPSTRLNDLSRQERWICLSTNVF
ncbi:MAG TPA: hypothetical protein IGS53_19375 [Leptolyngbyaceae cyanobacterium M33_DOE_097]|uniref:Uncharacterized protein n=1 Tax=Oscillatoriales cyanobacterium SpSt-418 TaxID=2282169 RepID=A0A7C3PRV7_9CYAN|nr:hypothetical protein [Leptolyngbyaceae cyanobacterium M33_DOE_097]